VLVIPILGIEERAGPFGRTQGRQARPLQRRSGHQLRITTHTLFCYITRAAASNYAHPATGRFLMQTASIQWIGEQKFLAVSPSGRTSKSSSACAARLTKPPSSTPCPLPRKNIVPWPPC